MSERDRDIEALIPFYALGTLSEEERAQVEQYASTRPELQAELDELVAAAAELPLTAEPVPGAAAEKEAFMARVMSDTGRAAGEPFRPDAESSAGGFSDWLRGLLSPQRAPVLAGAAVALVLAIALFLTLRSQFAFLEGRIAELEGEVAALNGENTAQRAEVRELAAENVALKEQLLNQGQILAALGRDDAQSVPVRGTESSPDASGALLVSRDDNRALLTVSGLAPLPAGQDYQLWLIEGDSPRSAGVFEVDEEGQSVYLFAVDPLAASFDAVGVSVEPAGGSQQPTGDIVLFGNRST